jgi:hypothetical protein
MDQIRAQGWALRNIGDAAPNCLVISEEFSEWFGSQHRIDFDSLFFHYFNKPFV